MKRIKRLITLFIFIRHFSKTKVSEKAGEKNCWSEESKRLIKTLSLVFVQNDPVSEDTSDRGKTHWEESPLRLALMYG